MDKNKATGSKGEAMAEAFLIGKGYTILEKNWRFKHLEVDIIAFKKNMLHFFEIKTRTSLVFGNPEESISQKKMNNLKSAAEEYQYLYPEWNYVQFNVLAITMLAGKPADFLLFEDVYF